MDARVFVNDWEMQCCGKPFEVGSEVCWKVMEPDREWLSTVLGKSGTAAVTYTEKHHGDVDLDSLPTLRGEVQAIRAVYCRLAPSNDRVWTAVPGTTSLNDVDRADGWEPAKKDLEFRGYLVDLRRTELVPAR